MKGDIINWPAGDGGIEEKDQRPPPGDNPLTTNKSMISLEVLDRANSWEAFK